MRSEGRDEEEEEAETEEAGEKRDEIRRIVEKDINEASKLTVMIKFSTYLFATS